MFAETEGTGKVSQIVWGGTKKGGTATLLVPVAAYDRLPKRAALRTLRVKVPEAKKVVGTKVEFGIVQTLQGNYYLVRAEFVI